MIIGKIWDCEFPWDVRVEKICRALMEAGHTIHLTCRNRQNLPLREQWNGIHIHRLPYWSWWSGRFEHWASFPAFVNPRWYRLIHRTFLREDVDVILCRDLPLAPVAVAVGRRLRRPVVIDVAEHYPGLLQDLYNPHNFKLRNLLIRNPVFASIVERLVLPAADRVLVVVEESGKRLESLTVDSTRIVLVSNTPPAAKVDAMASIRVSPRRNGGPLRLVYLGKIEYSRGLSVALHGLRELKRAGPPVTLDIFGTGRQFDFHVHESRRLGVEGMVTFHGHRPHDEAIGRLPSFDVGIIPHHATNHWNYTVQNKLFDYMAAGIPILVSSMPPAARIVSQTGAGLVFQDRDPHSFVDALKELRCPERRTKMGAAGRDAVRRRYSWEHDRARLQDALESVVRDQPHGLRT